MRNRNQNFRRRWSKFIRKITKISASNIFAFLAFVISLISFYYQFLNVNHEINYSFMEPEFDNTGKKMNVPIYFKNSGNQTELISNANLILEVKRDDGSNYYKRITDETVAKFPIILNANENKYIKLTANYEDYLFGSLVVDLDAKPLYFEEFTNLDSLKLKLTTQYLTTDGFLSNDTLDVGFISFSKQGTIDTFDFNAVTLRKLNLKSGRINLGGTKYGNKTISGTINLNDPKELEKNKAMIKFMQKTFKDSTFNRLTNPK